MFGILFFIIVGYFVLSYFTNTFPKRTGKRLWAAFQELGDVSGKSLDEVVAALGAATTASYLGDAATMVQWHAHGVHIALEFENNTCVGATHMHCSL